jgi:hypothetical protein
MPERYNVKAALQYAIIQYCQNNGLPALRTMDKEQKEQISSWFRETMEHHNYAEILNLAIAYNNRFGNAADNARNIQVLYDAPLEDEWWTGTFAEIMEDGRV